MSSVDELLGRKGDLPLDTVLDVFLSLLDDARLAVSAPPLPSPTAPAQHYLEAFLETYTALGERLRALRPKNSDFSTLRPLATGHFGRVSVVREKATGRTLALKTLDKRFLLRHRGRACFMEERDVLVLASPLPWFPRLHSAFQDDAALYLAMEFVPGGDLAGLLDRCDGGEEEGIGPEGTRFYIAELLLALRALHDLGYVHRDIKPGNILIDARGHIRLADFGACAPLVPGREGPRVKAGIPVGTPEYVAPEVLRAEEAKSTGYGPGCDLWSVGIVMYECLKGISPFWAESDTLTFAKVMEHEAHLVLSDPADATLFTPDITEVLLHLISDVSTRWGVDEAIAAPFFSSVRFETLWEEGSPPFIPHLAGPEDAHYFALPEPGEEVPDPVITSPRPRADAGFRGENLLFAGFSWSFPPDPLLENASREATPPPSTQAEGAALERSLHMVQMVELHAPEADPPPPPSAPDHGLIIETMAREAEQRQEEISREWSCRLSTLEEEKRGVEAEVASLRLRLREEQLERAESTDLLKSLLGQKAELELQIQETRESHALHLASAHATVAEREEDLLSLTEHLSQARAEILAVAKDLAQEVIPHLGEVERTHVALVTGLQSGMVDAVHAQHDLEGRIRGVEDLHANIKAERDSLLRLLGKPDALGGDTMGRSRSRSRTHSQGSDHTSILGPSSPFSPHSDPPTPLSPLASPWTPDPALTRTLMERDTSRREVAELQAQAVALRASLHSQQEATASARRDIDALLQDRDALLSLQADSALPALGQRTEEEAATAALRHAHAQGLLHRRSLETRIAQMEAAARWTLRSIPGGIGERGIPGLMAPSPLDGPLPEDHPVHGLPSPRGGERGRIQAADVWRLWSGAGGRRRTHSGVGVSSRPQRSQSGPAGEVDEDEILARSGPWACIIS